MAKQNKETKLRDILTTTIDKFRTHPTKWNSEKLGNELDVEDKILGRLISTINTQQRSYKLKQRLTILSAAAILFIGITVGFLFKVVLLSPLSSNTIIVSTLATQQKQITLPDGSVVILNSCSKFSYPKEFSDKNREVTLLEGEAFFDIKKDVHKLFIVKTNQTKTEVLGTAFNIRAYPFISDITITVARGKVAVSSPSAQGDKYLLTPNQQVSYSRDTKSIHKSEIKAEDALGWMEGKLIFNNESFSQVAGLLENKYNVKILFDQSDLEMYHFSASFDSSESVYDVIDALTLTKGLKYTVKDNTINISHPN